MTSRFGGEPDREERRQGAAGGQLNHDARRPGVPFEGRTQRAVGEGLGRADHGPEDDCPEPPTGADDDGGRDHERTLGNAHPADVQFRTSVARYIGKHLRSTRTPIDALTNGRGTARRGRTHGGRRRPVRKLTVIDLAPKARER